MPSQTKLATARWATKKNPTINKVAKRLQSKTKLQIFLFCPLNFLFFFVLEEKLPRVLIIRHFLTSKLQFREIRIAQNWIYYRYQCYYWNLLWISFLYFLSWTHSNNFSKTFFTNCNNKQKQPSEMFCKKKCSYKFLKVHRKTPVRESLFKQSPY